MYQGVRITSVEHAPGTLLCVVKSSRGTLHEGRREGVGARNEGNDGSGCEFAPNDLDGKTYQLIYNGDWLEGLPFTFADDGGYGMYIRLINLADGTTVTDGTTEYVVKAVALSESIRDANMTECTSRNLDFAADSQSVEAVKQSFAGIGFDVDELLPFDIENPDFNSVISSVDDYGGLPEFEWKQDFEGAANPVCTITHGDNSGCEE